MPVRLTPGDPRIGEASHRLHPGKGWCMRCRTAWGAVKWHDTHFCAGHLHDPVSREPAAPWACSGCQGCFPLCERCWAELSPELRLAFYRVHYERTLFSHRLHSADWQVEHEARAWPAIHAAVMAGR